MTLLVNFTKHFFQKMEKEAMFPNPFYEATMTVIPKPGKKIHKKNPLKLQTGLPHEYLCENSKTTSK